MYGVVLEEETGRTAAEARKCLGNQGIGSRPFFVGMHKQPALKDLGLFQGERYPVSEKLSRQGFYLPSGLTLTEGQIETVVDALRGFLL